MVVAQPPLVCRGSAAAGSSLPHTVSWGRGVVHANKFEPLASADARKSTNARNESAHFQSQIKLSASKGFRLIGGRSRECERERVQVIRAPPFLSSSACRYIFSPSIDILVCRKYSLILNKSFLSGGGGSGNNGVDVSGKGRKSVLSSNIK